MAIQLLRADLQSLRHYAAATGLIFYPCAVSMGLMLWSTPNTALLARFGVAAFFCLAFSLGLALTGRALPFKLVRRLYGGLLLLLLGVYTFSLGFHYRLYGQLFGVPTLYSILESTSTEASEYLRSVTRPDVLGFAVVLVIPLLFATRPLQGWFASSARYRSFNGLVGVSLLVGTAWFTLPKPNLQSHNPWLFIYKGVEESLAQRTLIKSAYANIYRGTPISAHVNSAEAVTHILVIGESTTSRHMSLYGYGRQTTPRLDSMRDALNIVADACSSRGNTTEALKEMLSFATRERPELLFQRPNLIQLMNSAGFRTYWLSNQQKVGNSDSWSEILSSSANERAFVNRRGWTDGISLDDVLLPELTRVLGDSASRRFIVMHLLGTHTAYALRYPSSFKKFDSQQDIPSEVLRQNTGLRRLSINSPVAQFNDYDNAVLYNDHIVASILAAVKGMLRASVTYLSDHGEALGEVDGFVTHVDGPAPKQVYQIPMFFFTTPQFSTDASSEIQALQQNLGKPFQSDQLIHTLLDLYGIVHPYPQPERSLASRQFTAVSRFCDTLTAAR